MTGWTDLALGTDVPERPTADERRCLLETLAKLIAAGGAGRLLAAPIEPGAKAFPERWRKTRPAVVALSRRLLWHAGLGDRAVKVVDARDQAVVTDRRVVTEVELIDVKDGAVHLALYSIGDDDVAGTIAHEVGVAAAMVSGVIGSDPYRNAGAALGEDDLRTGSVATVWTGLGVIAANAAYQQYTGGTYKAHLGFAPIEYDVIQAGHLPLPQLAFLLAVQAELRGEVPGGLLGPQRDEVGAWRRALAGRASELRAKLGIAADAVATARPPIEAWPDEPDAEENAHPGTAGAEISRVFRVPQDRGGLGAMIGVAIGAMLGMMTGVLAIPLSAGIVLGYGLGRLTKRDLCSHCVATVPPGAATCPKCKGEIAGTIAHRSQRLDHEDEDDA